MTSNQIDYYNARMKAKNDRLTRREQKRHNLAQESAQNLSASAALQSAAAAASQAGIANKRYQLEWETEYGVPYGSDPNDRSLYGEMNWKDDRYGAFPNNAVPQSYALKQYEIIKTGQQAHSENATRYQKYSQALANLAKGGKDLANTYYIITGE